MSKTEKMEYDDFLAHYGVLGMKWGVRKRSSDGGNSSGSSSSGKSSKEQKRVAKQEKADAKRRKKTGEVDVRGKTEEEIYKIKEDLLYSRDPKKIYANRRLFDYQEIARINGVLENESKIRNRIVPEKTLMQKVESGVNTAKKINDTYNTASKIAYNLGLINTENPIKSKVTDVKKQMTSDKASSQIKDAVSKATTTETKPNKDKTVSSKTKDKTVGKVYESALSRPDKQYNDDVNDLLKLYQKNMR